MYLTDLIQFIKLINKYPKPLIFSTWTYV